METTNTCCFTGHRDLDEKNMLLATCSVITEGEKLYKKGITNFICGGALGFDMAAAQGILKLKAEHPDILLTIAQPCIDYNIGWKEKDKQTYAEIFDRSDEIIIVSPCRYFNGCMQVRDKYLVDNSSYLIAWYDGRNEGGTLYTLNCARKCGLEVINVWNG